MDVLWIYIGCACERLTKDLLRIYLEFVHPGFCTAPLICEWATFGSAKILLLFQVESKTDLGMKRHSCAFVLVMEEYTGPQRPGERLILLIILIVNLCY